MQNNSKTNQAIETNHQQDSPVANNKSQRQQIFNLL